MSKISIKKDFKNGDVLYDVDLNNNFSVIEKGVNANEENLDNVIKDAELRLQKELESITADRGWDWNGGDRVTFFKGSDTEVEKQPIKNGQLLYNTTSGETALDDNGNRIVTGSGNVISISEEEPTNPSTKEWIKPSKMIKESVKEYVDDIYSTDEVKTNKIWVDGKSIYRKVYHNVNTGTLDSTWQDWLDCPENIQTITDIKAITDTVICPRYDNVSYFLNFRRNGNKIQTFGSGYSNYEVDLILEYTKVSE